jgi:hypothetical protein
MAAIVERISMVASPRRLLGRRLHRDYDISRRFFITWAAMSSHALANVVYLRRALSEKQPLFMIMRRGEQHLPTSGRQVHHGETRRLSKTSPDAESRNEQLILSSA